MTGHNRSEWNVPVSPIRWSVNLKGTHSLFSILGTKAKKDEQHGRWPYASKFDAVISPLASLLEATL